MDYTFAVSMKRIISIGAERLSVKLHDFMKSQRARQID